MSVRKSLTGRVMKFIISITLVLFLCLSVALTYGLYERMQNDYRNVVRTYINSAEIMFSQYMQEGQDFMQELYNSKEGIEARYSHDYQIGYHVTFLEDVRKRSKNFYQSVIIVNQFEKVTFAMHTGVDFPYRIEEEIEKRIESRAEGVYVFQWNLPNRYPDMQDVKLLSIVVQDNQIGREYYRGSVLLNINAQQLSEYLFGDSAMDRSALYIVDKNGIVVAHNDGTYIGEDWSDRKYIRQIIEQGTGRFLLEVDNKLTEFDHVETDYSGFYVISQSDYMDDVLHTMEKFIVGLMMVGVVFMITIIYFFRGKLFAPFIQLTNSMKESIEKDFNYKAESIYGDVIFIEEYHQLTQDYIRRMREKENKNLVVQTLLQNKWNQQMQNFLVENKFLASRGKYRVAIVYLDSPLIYDIDNIMLCNMQREKVEIMCCESLKDYDSCCCLELGLRRILLIISEQYEDGISSKQSVLNEFEKTMGQVIEDILDSLNIKVLFTVSEIGNVQTMSCDKLYYDAAQRLDALLQPQIAVDENGSHGQKEFRNRAVIEQIIDYLNQNYANREISSTMLAEQYHLSKDYMGKLFQEYVGENITNYLKDLRLEKAKNLLMTRPELTVIEVAQIVGFNNGNYFATCFKKRYGISPSQIGEMDRN